VIIVSSRVGKKNCFHLANMRSPFRKVNRSVTEKAIIAIISSIVLFLIVTSIFSSLYPFKYDMRDLEQSYFIVSEDDSGSYYYTAYKDGDTILIIRSAWNGGCCDAPTVRYSYFENNNLVKEKNLVATRSREDIDSIIHGSDAHTDIIELLYFEDSKLVKWMSTVEGVITPSDPRWTQREKASIDDANSIIGLNYN
jgi:hypothetical protein